MAPILLREIPISEYPAKTIKAIAIGCGSASKEDIINLMKLEFSKSGLVDKLREDAADAMAIGKAHHILNHSSVFARAAVIDNSNRAIEGKFRKWSSSPRTRSLGRRSSRSAMQDHLSSRGFIK